MKQDKNALDLRYTIFKQDAERRFKRDVKVEFHYKLDNLFSSLDRSVEQWKTQINDSSLMDDIKMMCSSAGKALGKAAGTVGKIGSSAVNAVKNLFT